MDIPDFRNDVVPSARGFGWHCPRYVTATKLRSVLHEATSFAAWKALRDRIPKLPDFKKYNELPQFWFDLDDHNPW